MDVSAQSDGVLEELARGLGHDDERVSARRRLAPRRLVLAVGPLERLRRLGDQGPGVVAAGQVLRRRSDQAHRLFIHSEETAANGQRCTSSYDDPFCWERAADYYSLGCIKLARPSPVASFPNDLGLAHSYYHSYGGSSNHGAATDAHELYVY
jgi:hypothetical protein